MLELLQKFALRFAWAKKPVFILLLVMVAVLVATVVFSGSLSQDVLLIPAILFFVWLLLLFSFLNLFAHVPARQSEAGLWQRLLDWFKRGFYYLFAVVMVLISIAVLVTTYQLTVAWLYMYII